MDASPLNIYIYIYIYIYIWGIKSPNPEVSVSSTTGVDSYQICSFVSWVQRHISYEVNKLRNQNDSFSQLQQTPTADRHPWRQWPKKCYCYNRSTHTLQIFHTQRTVCYIFGHQNETEFGNGQNVGHPWTSATRQTEVPAILIGCSDNPSLSSWPRTPHSEEGHIIHHAP
jgi:hypothetical protein